MIGCIYWLFTLPARFKGAKLGRKVKIAPGYDWLFVSWRNIRIESNTIVGRRAWIQTVSASTGKVFIGSDCSVGRDCVISSATSISIGSGSLLSYRVSILDHDHLFDSGRSPVGIDVGSASAVHIGARCFIGCNSTILKGVTLGDDVIVAAHSVVTRSFPSNVIVAGVPAKQISTRS